MQGSAGEAGHLTIREATRADLRALEEIRTADGWQGGGPDARVARYLDREHHPTAALPERVVYVALDGDAVAGYVAGHRTTRFGCEGELQWIAVAPELRGSGVAELLFTQLADWFGRHDIRRVCVDVAPENARARAFYRRRGAVDLKPHWLVWEDITEGRSLHSPDPLARPAGNRNKS